MKESDGVLTGMQRVKAPLFSSSSSSPFPLVFGLKVSADLVKLHLHFPQLLTGSQSEKEHKVPCQPQPGPQCFHLPSSQPPQEREIRVRPRTECLFAGLGNVFTHACRCGLLACSGCMPGAGGIGMGALSSRGQPGRHGQRSSGTALSHQCMGELKRGMEGRKDGKIHGDEERRDQQGKCKRTGARWRGGRCSEPEQGSED